MGQESSSDNPVSIQVKKKYQSTPHLFIDDKEKNEKLADDKLGQLSFNGVMPAEANFLQDFEKILDELSLPQDKKDNLRKLPADKKYLLYKQHKSTLDIQKSSTEESNLGPLKSADKQIEAVQQAQSMPKLFLKELLALEVALRTLPMSWVTEFFQAKGLEYLLRRFRLLCLQTNLDHDEREIQHQFIRCFRNIMNTTLGLTTLMDYPDAINILLLGYDCKNLRMKTKILEIMGAICLVLPHGHKLVVEAFSYFQRFKNESFKFQTLVDDLKQDDDELKMVCMALINAIVNSPEEQDFRVLLRSQFIDLKILQILQDEKGTQESDFSKHVSVFKSEAEEDYEDLLAEAQIEDVDLSDPDDMYATIKYLASEGECTDWMLKTFRTLLQISSVELKLRTLHWQSLYYLLEEVLLQRNQLSLDYFQLNFKIKAFIEGLATQEEVRKANYELENIKKILKANGKDIDQFRGILISKDEEIEELTNLLTVSTNDLKDTEAKLEAMVHKYELEVKSHQELKQELSTHKNKQIVLDFSDLPEALKSISHSRLEDMKEYLISKIPDLTVIHSKGEPVALHSSEEKLESEILFAEETKTPVLNTPLTAAPAPPPAPPPPPPPPPTSVVLASPNSKKRINIEPKEKMRPLQWLKIAENQISKTIWNNMQSSIEVEKLIDFTEFEQNFSVSDKHSKKAKDVEIENLPKIITLLDPKKSNNISIMLSRVKLNFAELRQAILSVSEEKLSESFVRQLLNFVPSNEEEALLIEHLESYELLGKPEQFYIEIMKITRYEQRLHSINFKRKLPERLEEIRSQVNILTKACRELMNSLKLKKILEIILITGNYMNSGSFRGNADGFSIKILPNLSSIKGNKKGTYLHFLNYIVDSKFQDLRSLSSELTNIEKASKISVLGLSQELHDISHMLEMIIEELPRHKKPEDENDKMYPVMKNFLDIYQPIFNKAQQEMEETESLFLKTIRYFGEEEIVSSEDFFLLFATFISSFERCHKENLLEQEMIKKSDKHIDLDKKRLTERKAKQQKLLDNSQRGVIDELVSSLKNGDIAIKAAEERRKNKRFSKAIFTYDVTVDPEALLEEIKK